VKDKRVENTHLKFHNILVILQFLVELTTHNGHRNESSVCKKKEWIHFDLSFFRLQQCHWLADFFIYDQNDSKK